MARTPSPTQPRQPTRHSRLFSTISAAAAALAGATSGPASGTTEERDNTINVNSDGTPWYHDDAYNGDTMKLAQPDASEERSEAYIAYRRYILGKGVAEDRDAP